VGAQRHNAGEDLSQSLKKVHVRLVVTMAIFSALLSYPALNEEPREDTPMKFKLNSHSFSDGGNIPKKYTCDGDDVSPELHWTGQPPAAKSFALIVDDPDGSICRETRTTCRRQQAKERRFRPVHSKEPTTLRRKAMVARVRHRESRTGISSSSTRSIRNFP
jgi:Phosphatidylethanolamine-binding protein